MWVSVKHMRGMMERVPLSEWLAHHLNSLHVTEKPIILHYDGKTIEAIVWVE